MKPERKRVKQVWIWSKKNPIQLRDGILESWI
ncbi:hypothetical protein P872_10195 [Rhodonellum psychrophilum GCM71 = DSM 17998]|uniref:Uncharacterized protein n=1 Tax=Rhodonellum psychrophilum GCM71 = DSM 17998 TaxID=1123057 RepID=U5BXX8_9BACT|nr:hypothetical protein P872_10195 [Rhodonellum psychrophilum GCM71 = DSM 17998]